MKSKIIIAATLIVVGFSSSGCIVAGAAAVAGAITPESSAKQKTADYFGVSTSSVRIRNYNKTLMGPTWKAVVSGVTYNCLSNLLGVVCERPGG